MAEATQAAEYATQILTKRFGEAPWIHQAAEAVKNAVQMCVTQLSGSGALPAPRSLAGGQGYDKAFPPRTTQQEIDAAFAADSSDVTKREVVDPAIKEGGDASQPDEGHGGGPLSWML